MGMQTMKGKEIEDPSDLNIPDNYVQHTLRTQKALPPITWANLVYNLNWTNVIVLGTTTLVSIWGPWTTPLQSKTFWWMVIWYYVTGLGITAGTFFPSPAETFP